jgi:hypothetical protein
MASAAPGDTELPYLVEQRVRDQQALGIRVLPAAPQT